MPGEVGSVDGGQEIRAGAQSPPAIAALASLWENAYEIGGRLLSTSSVEHTSALGGSSYSGMGAVPVPGAYVLRGNGAQGGDDQGGAAGGDLLDDPAPDPEPPAPEFDPPGGGGGGGRGIPEDLLILGELERQADLREKLAKIRPRRLE